MSLNRKIGYLKTEVVEKEDIIIPNNVKIENLKTEDIENFIYIKSKKIVDWIKDKPAIKWTVICKNSGVEPANFNRALKSGKPKLSLTSISKLESELAKYGYS